MCLSASFRLTLEEKTLEGETFLTLAVKAGLVENVKMLLDHGASPHTTNSKNESPLLLGQNTIYQQSVPLLLHSRHVDKTFGEDFPTSSSSHVLPAAVRAGSHQMVSCLIAGGAQVGQVCLKKWTAMHEASRAGCVHVMELLLQHGGQVSQTDQHGVTPLGIAAEYSHAEVLELLIKHGEL